MDKIYRDEPDNCSKCQHSFPHNGEYYCLVSHKFVSDTQMCNHFLHIECGEFVRIRFIDGCHDCENREPVINRYGELIRHECKLDGETVLLNGHCKHWKQKV